MAMKPVAVKDSPYAFSSVLAVYLLGIALGSRAIHRYLALKPRTNRRDLFFKLQFLIGLTVLLIFTGAVHGHARAAFRAEQPAFRGRPRRRGAHL
jgi:hypothetical protein